MACPGAKSIKGTVEKGGRPSLSGARGEPSCVGGYGGNEAHRARRTAKPWRVPGRILGARRRRLPAPFVTLLRKGRRLRGTRPVRSTCVFFRREQEKAAILNENNAVCRMTDPENKREKMGFLQKDWQKNHCSEAVSQHLCKFLSQEEEKKLENGFQLKEAFLLVAIFQI